MRLINKNMEKENLLESVSTTVQLNFDKIFFSFFENLIFVISTSDYQITNCLIG